MVEMKIVAVIPALNEEKTVSDVVKGAKRHVSEVVLVDDGSEDSTADAARKEGAMVIRHDDSQGYDRSIDDGFKAAAEEGADIVVTMDADGQHDPEDLPRILGPILQDKADVVVGNKPHQARVAERLFALYSRRSIGIADPLCGMKAYLMEVYRAVGVFDDSSSIGTQLMFSASRRGFRMAQAEVRAHHRADSSRFGGRVKANLKILRALLRVIRHRG